MKKLLFALLLLNIFALQAFPQEKIKIIVGRIAKTNNLSAAQCQELTDKLREHKKEMLEYYDRNRGILSAHSTIRVVPAGLLINNLTIDILTPYVKKNDPLLIEWVFESVGRRGNLPLARYLLEKDLVDPNVVDKDGVPLLYPALMKGWYPEFLDLLLEKGANLEAYHPVSGNTPLLELASRDERGKEPFCDYRLYLHNMNRELILNPTFEETFENNQHNERYKNKINDLYRMWYLIGKGANSYAINNKTLTTLADTIRGRLQAGTWDMQDWFDLRAHMVRQKEVRIEGAELAHQLPDALGNIFPDPLIGIIGDYSSSHYGEEMQEGDTVAAIDRFFAPALPA